MSKHDGMAFLDEKAQMREEKGAKSLKTSKNASTPLALE